MRNRQWTLSAILVGAISAAVYGEPAAAEPSEGAGLQSVVQGNTAFAVDLYRRLSEEPGNLFVSPYSISLALGMTYVGARGNTALEMAAALHFPESQEALHPALKDLTRRLLETASATGQKLDIANGLCLTGGGVSPEYKSLLENSYDAELFAGSVDKINAWVNDKTEGKIDKILEQLSPNSVCVLLNAIYFKSLWESQFEKSNTRNAPFMVSPGKEVSVPLMYQKCSLRILHKEKFQAASIPYKGGKMSMIILLPDDVDGLPALEKQLSAQSLAQWLGELDKAFSEEISFFLPKYKLETEYDLVSHFKALGMLDAFDSSGKADFTGMGWRKGELWISQVKHKAFVEVNEEGTEAAAATAVEMVTKQAGRPRVFRADHPFLFLVRDNETGALLFLGRLVNPAAA
ncbi:MAG TPA: serpin family protein [Candidatus Hydrogenedentes bacterium]|nr:serpin family protein [Candidatus Hydrogenedentota bacterium]HQH54076.1 serpin family protein [Candidatus Hydrogenedentota bacterium]